MWKWHWLKWRKSLNRKILYLKVSYSNLKHQFLDFLAQKDSPMGVQHNSENDPPLKRSALAELDRTEKCLRGAIAKLSAEVDKECALLSSQFSYLQFKISYFRLPYPEKEISYPREKNHP